MRKIFFLLSSVMLAASAFAQTDKVYSYINQYKNIAMQEMVRTGVPAAITLAQGLLESGCGQSELATKANNHFGIKCKTEWTGQKMYHDDDSQQECFRVYPSAEDSYRDHSDFLKNRPYYQDLFLLQPTDYKDWAYGLKKDGYATEKDYPANIIRIIETYHLEDFSDLVVSNKYNFDNNLASNNQPMNDENMNASASVKSSEVAISVQIPAPTIRIAQTQVSLPSYPTSTFYINKSKVMYAPKGASLLALAARNKINYNRLLELNNLKDQNILPEGRVIYLEKKSDKSKKEFHITQYGETLQSISDKEGVELTALEKYNQSYDADETLNAGEKIYLRK